MTTEFTEMTTEFTEMTIEFTEMTTAQDEDVPLRLGTRSKGRTVGQSIESPGVKSGRAMKWALREKMECQLTPDMTTREETRTGDGSVRATVPLAREQGHAAVPSCQARSHRQTTS